MKVRSILILLSSILALPIGAQDAGSRPSYGPVSLNLGEDIDASITVLSGSYRLSEDGGSGTAPRRPTLVIELERDAELEISVRSRRNVAMVAWGPDGRRHGSGGAGRAAELRIANAQAGRYVIWVGLESGQFENARLEAAARPIGRESAVPPVVDEPPTQQEPATDGPRRPDLPGTGTVESPGRRSGNLAQRAQIVRLRLPGGEIQDHDYSLWTATYGDHWPGPLVSQSPGGAIYVGWTTAGGFAKVGTLSDDLAYGRDLVSQRRRTLLDLIAHQGGFTVLWSEYETVDQGSWSSRNHHTLFVTDFDASGRRRWETILVQARDYDEEGDQGLDDDFGRAASLARHGTVTAAYFNTLRRWADGVVHQSEYLAFVDSQGRVLDHTPEWSDRPYPAGFSWGVSHSFRPHFVYDGSRYILATSGDAYPRGMIVSAYDPTSFATVDRVVDELPESPAGVAYQSLPVSTGGIATNDGTTLVLFDSRQGQTFYDVVGFSVTADGAIRGPFNISRSPRVNERIPRPAAFGEHFLVVYGVDSSDMVQGYPSFHPTQDSVESYAMVVDASGRIVEEPVELTVTYRPRARLRTLPDGSVVFIDVPPNGGGEVNVVRFRP